jgi:hypothetical protein
MLRQSTRYRSLARTVVEVDKLRGERPLRGAFCRRGATAPRVNACPFLGLEEIRDLMKAGPVAVLHLDKHGPVAARKHHVIAITASFEARHTSPSRSR